MSALAVLALLAPFGSLQAQTYTWTQNLTANATVNWADGSWDTVPASGSGNIAAFNITGAAGSLTVNSTPAITLGGISTAATNSRAITLNGGLITLAATGTPTFNHVSTGTGVSLTIANQLAGTQGFTKTGQARLQLNGNNTGLSGAVSLDAGATVLGNDNALGTGTVTLNGGLLNGGIGSGTRAIGNNLVWNSGNLTLDTNSGTGATGSTFQVNGTVTLNGANGNLISSSLGADLTQNYVFANTVSGGTSGNSFTINNGNSVGNVFATFRTANTFAHDIIINGGGTTPLGGKLSSQGIAVGNNTALSGANVTVNNNVQRFVIASEDSTARTLSNNFVWTTTGAASGNAPFFHFTLGQSTLATTPGVTSFGGTGNITIGNLDVAAATSTIAAGARRIVVEGSTVGTINGVFSRSGSLAAASMTIEKTGTGTLVLANSGNTYDGGFTVGAGTLLVNGNLGGTGVSVSSGATLGGSGTISAATTIAAGATLAPGTSPGVLAFSNTLNLGGNAAFELNSTVRGTGYDGVNTGAGLLTYGGTLSLSFGSAFLAGDTTFDLFQIGAGGSTGTFSSIASAALYQFTLNSGNSYTAADQLGNTWTFNHSTGDLSFTAIPEPSTYALLLGGLGLLVFLRRRKA